MLDEGKKSLHRLVWFFFSTTAMSALAEMDGQAYAPAEIKQPRSQIERQLREIEVERLIAAQAEEERRLAEEAAQRMRMRELAARPEEERLLEARCLSCHAAKNYEEAGGHAFPGWMGVILRMRLLNGASISATEMWVIARHLAQRHPAPALRSALEWASLLILPVGGMLAWRRWLRKTLAFPYLTSIRIRR
ncbi:MAG: hypothetical protein N2441_08040 [Rhodocyclaceae bacterium]|nr:hypothetical protein [Rhodocyclaceae bacterium]